MARKSIGIPPITNNQRLDVKRLMEAAQVNIILQNTTRVLDNMAKKVERAHKILHQTMEVTDDKTGQKRVVDAPVSEDDMEMVKLSDRAEERLLQSIGVVPSKSMSVMIGKIVQQNNTIIPPEALAALKELSDTSGVLDLKQLGMDGTFEADKDESQ